MLIIGENIHIIAPKIKEAITNRDTAYLQKAAMVQWKAGAQVIDLNIGPQKKLGVEIMEWAVEAVQDAIPGVTLSLDTTNAAAIEAGLKKCKKQAFINSTSAEEDRMAAAGPLAAKYGANIIALTMTKSGIPVGAEERFSIAMELLIPGLTGHGVPIENIYFDPLVLTVAGSQEFVPNAVETIRLMKLWDPPLNTVVGLSNVSNQVPNENRGLINRTYMVMLMAAGLDSAIADPLDKELMRFIRIVEKRDDSTGVGRVLLHLFDTTQTMEPFDPSVVDMNDEEQVGIYKTVRILRNEIIFADSYLKM